MLAVALTVHLAHGRDVRYKARKLLAATSSFQNFPAGRIKHTAWSYRRIGSPGSLFGIRLFCLCKYV